MKLLYMLAALLLAILVSVPMASASTTHSWMIGQPSLASLNSLDPTTAKAVFNRSGSYVITAPPSGYATTHVTDYKSYVDYQSNPSPTHWVLYDPEKWSYTPLNEQQHPGYWMAQFATLAHSRGQQVIMTPARDLVDVSGANCTANTGESMDAAYLRCNIPSMAANAPGDVVEIQAQGDQSDTTAFSSLVSGSVSQVHTGAPVWVGLTTLRGDPVSAMTSCYNAVQGTVQGFWLNTSTSTVDTADQFLKSVNP